MAGENFFKIKFTGDGNGNGKGVLLKPGEGVKPLAKGGNLENLLKNATDMKTREIEPENMAAQEKKIEVVSHDEIPAADIKPEQSETVEVVENKNENPIERYKKSIELAVLEMTTRINQELAENGKNSGKVFHLLKDEIVEHLLDVGENDEAVELMSELQAASIEDARKLVIEEIKQIAGGRKNKEEKSAAKIIVKICNELLGNSDKEEMEAAPTVMEKVEQEKGNEQIKFIFEKIFDDNKFKGRTFEVSGEKPYSISRAISTGNFPTGAISKMREAFEAQYDGGTSEEEILKASLAFCKERVGEFAKKELQQRALLLACEEFGGETPIEKKEKDQEVSKEEFEKIEQEIVDIVNLYESKILMGEKNGLFGEKTVEVVAAQRKRLRETINGVGDLLKRFKEGEQSGEMLFAFKKHRDDLVRLKDEIFIDKTVEKTGPVKLEKKDALNYYLERVEQKFAGCMKTLEERKNNPAFVKKIAKGNRNKNGELFLIYKSLFSGSVLTGRKEKVLLDKITELNDKLEAAYIEVLESKKDVAGDSDGEAAGAENVQWQKEFAEAAEKIREVDHAEFAKLKVQKFQDLDLKAEFLRAVNEGAIAPENLDKALELAKGINDPNQNKELVVFDGETYVAEGIMEEEPSEHQEEVVDSHADLEEEKAERGAEDQEIFETFAENAVDVGNFLIGEFEKEKVFPEGYSVEMKTDYIRPKVMLICFELLKTDYGFSVEKAKEFAQEISKNFQL